MIRSTVCTALTVCRVLKTRWPVSAALRAASIVSASRISPMRITSGLWRTQCLSAAENERVSRLISRCWISDRLSW